MVRTGEPNAVDSPWARSGPEVLAGLSTSATSGLDEQEAARRLEELGRNVLRASRGPSLRRMVLAQLRDTMIVVLLCAAVLTVLVGDLQDTVVILVVVAVNSVLGVSQEYRAEHAVAALAQLSAPTAHVVRSGAVRAVDAAELVPGDVVRLEAGDIVPADARLLEAAALQTDEAPLTGESVPVGKDLPASDGHVVPVAERTGMVHAGTVVTAGRGLAVVTSTGMGTEVGRLAQLLDEQVSPPTPLQQRLRVLGRQIAAAAVALCGLVLVLGLLRGQDLEQMLLTAISLAVAAVPESLPAVVALSLALSAQRMASRRAIIRTLPAVEALGSVTVIASDKTGTLTEGVMVARRVWTPGVALDLTGVGYDPTPLSTAEVDATLVELLTAAVLCNDARLVAPPAGTDDDWSVVGDPTEGALLAAAGRAGLEPVGLLDGWERVAEVPFDAGRARMTTVHRGPGGDGLVVCKGAPEVLLGTGGLLAAGQDAAVAAALAEASALAEQGFRVLAVASARRDDLSAAVLDATAAERSLLLLGLVALQDPPRGTAADSVAQCLTAGIVPIMITGDHPSTAASIAASVGILADGHRVVTGRQLPEALRDDDWDAVRVYARTAPEQKLDIVEAWRSAGHVVAMTGDGVNDAPALRRADVGVAMGRSGTEVARQAADVVLADDQFGTIVTAVGEGRRVYANIRRFLLYGLAGGTAEVLLMLVGPFLGLALPLLPAQILWVNLLTHGLPGVALGAEQAEASAMQRPPRDPTDGVLGDGLWQRIGLLALAVAAVTLGVGVWAEGQGLAWQTMVFVTLTASQLLLALVLRSESRPGWRLGGNDLLLGAVALNAVLLLLGVYWEPLSSVLRTDALSGRELGIAFAASLVAPVGVELVKLVRRRR